MRPTPGGPTCCATAAPAASPATSTSTGRPDDKVLLPILGRPLDEVLAAGELDARRRCRSATSPHRLPAVDGGLENASTGGSPGGAAPAIASTGGASSTSTSWSACAWRSPRPSRPSMPCRSACIAEGIVDGLRIDHVDGLADPAAYCRRAARATSSARRAWLVVEKILLRGETPAGRLGLRRHHRLRLHGRGERPAARRSRRARLAEAWAALSGRPADFAAEEEAARREIFARSFGAQLDACAAVLRAVASSSTPAAAPRAGRAAGAFPGLSHLRPRRRALGRRSRRARRAAAGARRTCLATDRWAIDPRAAPVRASADRARGRRALPAAQRADRRQGGRGHRLLSLRPPAVAQRCRLRSPTPSPSTPTPSTAACSGAGPTGRTRCWPPPPTTTSAARTCARGSRC